MLGSLLQPEHTRLHFKTTLVMTSLEYDQSTACNKRTDEVFQWSGHHVPKNVARDVQRYTSVYMHTCTYSINHCIGAIARAVTWRVIPGIATKVC